MRTRRNISWIDINSPNTAVGTNYSFALGDTRYIDKKKYTLNKLSLEFEIDTANNTSFLILEYKPVDTEVGGDNKYISNTIVFNCQYCAEFLTLNTPNIE